VGNNHKEHLAAALKGRDKHYRGLIYYICTNMPKHKRNAFTLANIIGEGSTYGHAIWQEFIPDALKKKYQFQR